MFLFNSASENANSIYIDLSLDESSFNKRFMFIDNEAYCYQTTNIQEDFQLPSLRIVEREYIHEIEEGIKAFENYLINEFG